MKITEGTSQKNCSKPKTENFSEAVRNKTTLRADILGETVEVMTERYDTILRYDRTSSPFIAYEHGSERPRGTLDQWEPGAGSQWVNAPPCPSV